MKKLTNTFKLTHKNEQNTKETSYLDGKWFHTPHASSLYNLIYVSIDEGKKMINLHKTKGKTSHLFFLHKNFLAVLPKQ
jgi:hypothetical protein